MSGLNTYVRRMCDSEGIHLKVKYICIFVTLKYYNEVQDR